ncbi:MAG TPA: hypothetical protein VGB13_03960 [Candidatus Krumholzibacteria bacterium]
MKRAERSCLARLASRWEIWNAVAHLAAAGSSHEQAWINGGDDIGFLRSFADVDLGDPVRIVGRTVTALGRGQGAGGRARAVARFLGDPRGADNVARAHCETAVRLSARLGLSAGVQRALHQMYERWDGRGAPEPPPP